MFQTEGAMHAKTALENIRLGERGPLGMEDRGQVPNYVGQLGLIVWTIYLCGSSMKNLLQYKQDDGSICS